MSDKRSGEMKQPSGQVSLIEAFLRIDEAAVGDFTNMGMDRGTEDGSQVYGEFMEFCYGQGLSTKQAHKKIEEMNK